MSCPNSGPISVIDYAWGSEWHQDWSSIPQGQYPFSKTYDITVYVVILQKRYLPCGIELQSWCHSNPHAKLKAEMGPESGSKIIDPILGCVQDVRRFKVILLKIMPTLVPTYIHFNDPYPELTNSQISTQYQ